MPKQLLLTIETGRYVWYEELQVIDFIPKGKKNLTSTIHLSAKDNNREDALKHIIQKMSQELLACTHYTHIGFRVHNESS